MVIAWQFDWPVPASGHGPYATHPIKSGHCEGFAHYRLVVTKTFQQAVSAYGMNVLSCKEG